VTRGRLPSRTRSHRSDQFAIRRQNDPHEFLLFLLGRLSAELAAKPLPPPPPTPLSTAAPPPLLPPGPSMLPKATATSHGAAVAVSCSNAAMPCSNAASTNAWGAPTPSGALSAAAAAVEPCVTLDAVAISAKGVVTTTAASAAAATAASASAATAGPAAAAAAAVAVAAAAGSTGGPPALAAFATPCGSAPPCTPTAGGAAGAGPDIVRELFAVELCQQVVCGQCQISSRRSEESHGVLLTLPGRDEGGGDAAGTGGATGAGGWLDGAAGKRTRGTGRAGGDCGSSSSSSIGGGGGSSSSGGGSGVGGGIAGGGSGGSSDVGGGDDGGGEGVGGEGVEGGGLELLSCLRAFVGPEALEGSNRYWCDRCAASCAGTRRTLVARLPPLLVLSVARTWWSARHGQVKDERWLSFPTQFDAAFLQSEEVRRPSASLYQLRAVISHSGRSAEVGHYFTYVRAPPSAGAPEQWHLLNDRRVSRVSEEQVRRCQAYMLFYETTS